MIETVFKIILAVSVLVYAVLILLGVFLLFGVIRWRQDGHIAEIVPLKPDNPPDLPKDPYDDPSGDAQFNYRWSTIRRWLARFVLRA